MSISYAQRFLLVVLSVIIPISLLTGCESDDPSSSNTPVSTKGKIQGSLVRKFDNQAAAGAKVTLLPLAQVRTTLSNGTFVFDNVEAGTYSLTVEWDGKAGPGGTSGVVVSGGKTTNLPLTISTPIGNWNVTLTFLGTPKSYSLRYLEDMSFELSGDFGTQYGTWSISGNTITMDASGTDRYTGTYSDNMISGTIVSGVTGTWVATR